MALDWAEKRRLMIIGGAVLILLTIIAVFLIVVLYKVPTCTDGIENQDEEGIDCGGSCMYLCTLSVQEPRIVFARALTSPLGRTDVVAYIENRNQGAEVRNAPYTVEVFDEGGVLLGSMKGTIDLPARTTVPLFVPGVVQGVGATPRAFISFDRSKMLWQKNSLEETGLSVRDAVLELGDRPRARAVLENRGVEAIYNVTLVATVFDISGSAIAASQTSVRAVTAGATQDAVFTWTAPFVGNANRVEVRILPSL